MISSHTKGKLKLGPTGEESDRLIEVEPDSRVLRLQLGKIVDNTVGVPGRSNKVTIELKHGQARNLALMILHALDAGRTVQVRDLLPLIDSASE